MNYTKIPKGLRPTSHLIPVTWRAPQATFSKFNELMTELVGLSQDDPRYAEICEEARSLPGYPHWTTPETHIIHAEVSDVTVH